MSQTTPLDEWLTRYIPDTHARIGLANLAHFDKEIRTLLTHRRLPEIGWSDHQIQLFLYQLATLDTNHKQQDHNRWCGVGEREGRVYSPLVRQRHFGLAHGIGRSGDLRDPQPKAAGSTILARLCTDLALDAMRRVSVLPYIAQYGIVAPVCTGMSISLVLAALRNQNPEKGIVLWSRIDQKSCFKAILTAGLTCRVVPTTLEGDQVITDIEAMRAMAQAERDHICAIITTTSCFAPRVPDRVDVVAELCAEFGIPHVINHAYGLQCAKTCKLIERAHTKGRVDAVVVSTDKNFLVPVGGAIIVSPHNEFIERISKVYAGRASGTAVHDLFITLLSMGYEGYKNLLDKRQKLLESFPAKLRAVAERYGERQLSTDSKNTISFGITLDGLARPQRQGETEEDYFKSVQKDISQLGAMLFTRCVSGTRVVPRGIQKSLDDTTILAGFGSSHHAYPHAYLTAAVAIGLGEDEADEFLRRLDKTLKEFKKKQLKKEQAVHSGTIPR